MAAEAHGSSDIHFNRMDNAGFEEDQSASIELERVPELLMTTANGNGVLGCTERCLALHQQHMRVYQTQEEKTQAATPESPWHRLKTIFLVGTIIALVIWIIVYTTLSQLQVL